MMKAVLIMLAAMSCIPAGDAASKVLTSQIGLAPGYVVWTRFGVGLLLVLPFTWRSAARIWRDWRVWARAALLAMGIASITQAFALAPLADVFGAFFIGPIVSFVLSVVWLRERVHAVQWVLLFIGFAGVLMIVQPGFEGTAGLGWAVLAGVCYGIFLTMSRWLAGQVSVAGLVLSQMLGALVATTPFVFGSFPGQAGGPDWSAQIIWLTLASGGFSMAGNVLLLFAYRLQDASRLAPFVYVQIVSALVLGWAVFGQFPDALALAGIVLIIGAGAFNAALASRRPRAAAAELG